MIICKSSSYFNVLYSSLAMLYLSLAKSMSYVFRMTKIVKKLPPAMTALVKKIPLAMTNIHLAMTKFAK